MHVLKTAALILAALLGLAVLAVAIALLLIHPDDYRAPLQRLAEARTGRALQIRGPLDLKVFPRLAISIAEVSVGNPAGFGTEPFVTIKQASVGVKLFPLLRKRLEVSRVTVDGLTASLISRSEKDNNWRDLAQPKEVTSQPAVGTATQTTIEGVDILHANLAYRDESKKSVTSLSNLAIHTGSIGGSEAVQATAEFDYGDGRQKPVAHISLSARAELPAASARVALRDLVIRGEWFGEAPQGASPVSISIRSAAVALDTQSQALTPATFDLKVGGLAAQLSAAGQKLFADRTIFGRLTVPEVSARTALATAGVALPRTRDPRALGAVSFSSDYVLTAKQLRLSNVHLMLDDTRIAGKAAVDDLQTMAVSYDLSADAVNVDRYLPPKPASQPAATRNPSPQRGATHDVSPPVPLPVETIRKLNVRGLLRVDKLMAGGVVCSAVSLPLTASHGQVHLGPTHALVLGGTYDGDILLDASPAQARLSLSEHAKALDVGALVKASFDTTRISGHGDANAVVNGVGNTDSDILRSLAGKIDVNVKNGAFEGLDLWYELRRARAVLKGAPVPARSGPERTPFNTFSGSGNLVKGVLSNDDLSITTDYLKVRGRGTLDLSAKAIDYSLVAQLYQIPPEGAGSELTDLKSVDIPFTVSGTFEHMAIRPDIEALAKAKVRQEVNGKLQQKGEELKKKLTDKLQGLFGH